MEGWLVWRVVSVEGWLVWRVVSVEGWLVWMRGLVWRGG